ncbi:hypothetical protein KOR42_26110 [Thalassoglobus neptunius]|uniref:DUF1559 domain-containing protein n=1 Tax=Thalassoglobus neptunius TaxID=1938619 RepID=A0A5C5WZ23_9PLAN|nr:DUF1559 domain-containing protein [Thalassoglobus neptunius]TWT55800.1 hypothetical protein KOR42_26110 [Thalassoglobus neptunius]
MTDSKRASIALRNKGAWAGFTLVEFLVAIGIIMVLISMLVPAINRAREVARATQCKNQLRQISLAIHGYHDAHETLPPGYIDSPGAITSSVESGWGWYAMLLPHLDQQPLYEKIDFHDGLRRTKWDSGDVDGLTNNLGNQSAVAIDLPSARCPSDFSPTLIARIEPGLGAISYATTSYAAMTGPEWMSLPCRIPGVLSEEELDVSEFGQCELPGGAFFLNSRTRFVDLTDGISTTLLIGEVSGKLDHIEDAPSLPSGLSHGGSHWARVSDPVLQEHVLTSTHERVNRPSIGTYSPGLSSGHPGGVQCGFADGSVRFLSDEIDSSETAPYGVLQHLSTIDGEEAIPSF